MLLIDAGRAFETLPPEDVFLPALTPEEWAVLAHVLTEKVFAYGGTEAEREMAREAADGLSRAVNVAIQSA